MAQLPSSKHVIELSSDSKKAIEKLTKALEQIGKLQPGATERIQKAFNAYVPEVSDESNKEWVQIMSTHSLFITKDGSVISLNDQEYLKPCGEPVLNQESLVGDTYCCKMVGHPHPNHEDKFGYIRRTTEEPYDRD